MTKGTKILLGIGATVLGLIAILIIAVGAIGYYAVSDPAAKKAYDDALRDGPEAGRLTDQDGCIAQGLNRLSKPENPKLNDLLANDVFVRECLAASKPVAHFCDGVPVVPYNDWIEDQCSMRNMSGTACSSVYDAKHTFCNGL